MDTNAEAADNTDASHSPAVILTIWFNDFIFAIQRRERRAGTDGFPGKSMTRFAAVIVHDGVAIIVYGVSYLQR